jgi:AraC-like DNA-binding protein
MPQLPDVLKIQNQAPFVSAFERIVMRKKLTESSNDGLLLTYLLEIMMLIDSESKISRQTSGHESELKRNINQAARYIATSYNEPLTVEKLSETVGMSPSYFASVFTKMMKVSPIEMLIRTRIYHARELLRHTDLTVSEIAQLCGFCSSQYFARTFLKRQNLTPTEYRERSR